MFALANHYLNGTMDIYSGTVLKYNVEAIYLQMLLYFYSIMF